MRSKAFRILMSACAVTTASISYAAAIASDSYVTGSNLANGEYAYDVPNSSTDALKNQPAGLVNTGFINGPYGSGSGTANWVVSNTGLDNPNVGGETGGSVSWIAPSRDSTNRSVARNLGSGSSAAAFNTTTNSVFYTSVQLQRGDLPTAADATSFIGEGFANTTAPLLTGAGATLFGAYVGFSGTTTGVQTSNFGSLVIRSRSSTSTTTAFDTILIDGATTSTASTNYFVVLKNTVNNPTDSVEYWVNPTNVTSDATMTSSAAVHGIINTTNGGGYQYNGGTADVTRLNYAAYNWDGTVQFDEPRLGLALSDVATSAPEPASLSLVAATGLLLARRRRA